MDSAKRTVLVYAATAALARAAAVAGELRAQGATARVRDLTYLSLGGAEPCDALVVVGDPAAAAALEAVYPDVPLERVDDEAPQPDAPPATEIDAPAPKPRGRRK